MNIHTYMLIVIIMFTYKIYHKLKIDKIEVDVGFFIRFF